MSYDDVNKKQKKEKVKKQKEPKNHDAVEKEIKQLTWKRGQLEQTILNLSDLEQKMEQTLEDCGLTQEEIDKIHGKY